MTIPPRHDVGLLRRLVRGASGRRRGETVREEGIELLSLRVRSSVVRVPPITHSTLDRHGIARTLIAIAKQTRVPLREIAQSIGDHLGISTASIADDRLHARFGFLAMVIALPERWVRTVRAKVTVAEISEYERAA